MLRLPRPLLGCVAYLSRQPARRFDSQGDCQEHDLQEYLDVASCYVRDAGKIITDGFYGVKTISSKAGDAKELVTEYDREVEHKVVERLYKKFPRHKFIGEENTYGKKLAPELTDCPTWILDPIDGTNNFIHGMPMLCSSLGLCVKQEVVVGIVYNPLLDQMFTAIKGKGAFLNDRRIKASKITELKKSLLGAELSFARMAHGRERTMKLAQAYVESAHCVRSIGSAALTLAYIAMGGFDGYQNQGLNCWDVAAGELLIREAGGVVLDTNGSPFNLMERRILCAGTPQLADELLKLGKTVEESLGKAEDTSQKK